MERVIDSDNSVASRLVAEFDGVHDASAPVETKRFRFGASARD